MTALEKQELEKLRQEKEKRRKQAKQWNENAKKKWETVSCRLPLGTKKRIDKAGESVNGIINRLVLAELERIENAPERSADQDATPAADQEPKQETAENETEKGEEKPPITWDVLAEMQKSGNFDFSKYQ